MESNIRAGQQCPSPTMTVNAWLVGQAMTGGGWVYIMANRPNGILYVGVTGDIARRAWKTRLIVAGNPRWQDLYEQII